MAAWVELWMKAGNPCFFHQVTGMYCPGCGGTRALWYLTKGELIRSFFYHPLVLYVAAALCLEVISYLLSVICHRPSLFFGRFEKVCVWAVVLLILNWAVKNGIFLIIGNDFLI